jgi:hypothetical protein
MATIPGFSLRSNPGLKLANAFGVKIQTEALPNTERIDKRKSASYGVGPPTLKRSGPTLCYNTTPTLEPQPSRERMKIMLNDNSAVERDETPHTINPTKTDTLKVNRCIAVGLRRRAESVIRDRSIDAGTRSVIRYALETSDPWLAELVRRADGGESLLDTVDFSQTPSTDFNYDWPMEEKVEVLTEIICHSGSGDDRATRSAALLVLIASIESSPHPRELAAVAKQLAFTRCGEMNVCGMIESQTAVLEAELFAGRTLAG